MDDDDDDDKRTLQASSMPASATAPLQGTPRRAFLMDDDEG
jgi:hypothetical protein